MSHPPHRHSRAFTLIEMLISLVVIAIILAIAVPAYLAEQSKAKDQKAQQYLGYAYRAIKASALANNYQFPSTASMVAAVQQSEPELAVISGSCYTLTSLSNNEIVVDTSSTSGNLLLCDKAESGNIWKATATPTGAVSYVSGTAVPLTYRGNEISDTVRAAALQGDGLSSDSSTGVWEASSNIVPNGGGEGSATGYLSNQAATVSRTTATAKFGSSSFQAVCNDNTRVMSVEWRDMSNNRVAVTAGTSYTFSLFARSASSYGISAHLQVVYYDGSGTILQTFNGTNKAVPTSWQGDGTDRFSLTSTAPASSVSARLIWTANASDALNDTYYFDGVQLEALGFATPYIETSGSTATRSYGWVQAPSAPLSSSQMWVAIRVRLNFPSTTSGNHIDFSWNDGTTGNYITLGSQGATYFFQTHNGTGYDTVQPVASWNTGDTVTLIGTLTPTTISISVNGGSFSNVTRAPHSPTGLLSTFDIGSDRSVSQLDGDILWLAAGTGTLSNSDSASIYSWGNSDPAVASFPAAAQASFVWNGGISGSLK